MDLNQKHFERSAQHHAHIAKRHHAMVKIAQKGMTKADADPADVLSEVLQEILAIASEHEEMSTHCSKCAKTASEAAADAAEKAAADRFGKRTGQDAIVPTEVRGNAIPSHPGYTAVPRGGQPPIAQAADAIRDLQIRKTIGLDESDQHSEELSIERR
jgi:hypothetical protein